jgi:hypothetical protein
MPRVKITVGRRVRSKARPHKYGNVTKGAANGHWMVRWDDAAVDEERSRQQLELVTASTALSPGAKRARKARAGGKSASEDEGSGSDSSSSSASEDEVPPEPANIYAARSEAFDLQMEPKYGTTVTVRTAFDIFPLSLSDAPPSPPGNKRHWRPTSNDRV